MNEAKDNGKVPVVKIVSRNKDVGWQRQHKCKLFYQKNSHYILVNTQSWKIFYKKLSHWEVMFGITLLAL